MGRLADRRKALRLALLAIVLLWGTLPTTAVLAAFEADDQSWEGASRFVELAREELGSDRVRPIRALDYSVLRPGDALVFLHPREEIKFHALAAFLGNGGRAAVLDDHGKGDQLLRRFHVHRVNAPVDPALTLRDNAELPIALPAPAEGEPEAVSEHRTLVGVDQVVANHPTALRLEEGVELTPLLFIPTRSGRDVLFAVTGVIGDASRCGLTRGEHGLVDERCGRLVAMGDPSAFINLMLRYPGNQAFARGLVQYLVEDDAWGSRSGNLYVLSGRFLQIGGAEESSGVASAIEEARAAVAGLIEGFRDEGLPEPVSIALAAAVAVAVVAWAAVAGGQRLLRAPPIYARPIPLAAQGGYAGRFAVLALPSTDRALLLLELKRALEDALRQRMRLSPSRSGTDLLEPARSRGLLSDGGLRTLGWVFGQLAAAEVAVLGARRLSMSDRALEELHRRVREVLEELGAQEG